MWNSEFIAPKCYLDSMAAEKTSEIDAVDRKIILELGLNARISFRELGKRVSLSSNATAERVRRLLEAGVLRGFHADVDRTKLGQSLQAYVDVKLRPETSANGFQVAAMKVPGILSMATTTGPLDLRLRVACRDQSDLVRLIEAIRSKAGVQETNTSVILSEITRWS